MTEYIILRRDDILQAHEEHLEERWKPVSAVKASSARRALAVAQVGEGEYVAAPARSWRPLKVSVEKTTKVTIS